MIKVLKVELGLTILFNVILDVQIQVSRFVTKYLQSDGILILRLISQHADVVFTTELIYKLWESHYTIELQRE